VPDDLGVEIISEMESVPRMKRVIALVAKLFAVFVLCALVLAALVKPSALLASTLFTLTLGLLSLVTSLGFVRQGTTRMYWVGFAAFGWPYFVVAFPWGQHDGVNPPLLLPAILLLAIGPYGDGFDQFVLFDIGYYLPLGQCLATMAFASVGAMLIRFVAGRSGQPLTEKVFSSEARSQAP
jgi:hypothetical protein